MRVFVKIMKVVIWEAWCVQMSRCSGMLLGIRIGVDGYGDFGFYTSSDRVVKPANTLGLFNRTWETVIFAVYGPVRTLAYEDFYGDRERARHGS